VPATLKVLFRFYKFIIYINSARFATLMIGVNVNFKNEQAE